MRKCPICEKGELIKAEDMILELDGFVFVVKGERCNSCNEEIPYEDETKRIVSASKRLGIWPEPMKLYRQLSKSGNGLVFRIPADIEKQLKLDDETEISITKIGNKIVISPEKA